MTLRSWFQALSTVLLGAVALAAALLLSTSGHLAESSQELTHRLDRARVSNELARALSSHRREDLLWSLTSDRSHLEAMAQAERHMGDAQRTLEADARTPEERETLHTIRGEVDAYLVAARMHDRDSAQLREASVELSFQDAREKIFREAARQLDDVEALRTEALHFERVARTFGVALILVCTVGSLFVVVLLRRRLVRPVEQLLTRMRRLRAGERVEAGVLPGEFGELAQALDQMDETIRRQRSAQLTFVSGVAHDVRTPLAAMKLQLALLRPGRPLPSEERLRQLGLLLDRQVERLHGQVEELLEATRVEAGELRVRLEATNLAPLVRDVAELFAHSGTQHPISVETPESLVARVDAMRLHRVLTNLVSNAIKYSPEGGPVELALFEEEDALVATVTDHGIGMRAEDAARAFEPFRRGRAEELRIPGVGLGLSVSRRIVEAHGGTILVRSTPGEGSTFEVRLPRALLVDDDAPVERGHSASVH